MSKYSQAFIGLGSNLENPSYQINSALKALSELPHSKELTCAPWYSSKAVGPGDQPDYINTVVSLETTLPQLELLHHLQAIENQQGRKREVRWGARTLDLDLLLYDNIQHNCEELTLPHPEIQDRSFVLLPLYDLAPELVFPNGNKLEDLAKQCDTSGLELMASCDTNK